MNFLYKQKNALFVSALLFALLCMCGCVRRPSTMRKIKNNLQNRPADFTQKQNNVTLNLKKLTRKETKAVCCSSRIKKRYKFLQLEINNQTDNTYTLNNQSFSIKYVPAKKLYKKNKHSWFKLLLAPLLSIISIEYSLGCFVIIASGGNVTPLDQTLCVILGGIGGLLVTPIASTLWGIKLHKDNRKLKKGLASQNIFTDNLVIKPHTTSNLVLVFEKKHAHQDLVVNLLDKTNKTCIPFTVPLSVIA